MPAQIPPKTEWLAGDFNGMLESGLLCLSHSDTAKSSSGKEIRLQEGMLVTVYELDADENNASDDIFASGIVVPSPDYAQCNGSKWSLRIDESGIRHESDLRHA
jgi:hypothetical protein